MMETSMHKGEVKFWHRHPERWMSTETARNTALSSHVTPVAVKLGPHLPQIMD